MWWQTRIKIYNQKGALHIEKMNRRQYMDNVYRIIYFIKKNHISFADIRDNWDKVVYDKTFEELEEGFK